MSEMVDRILARWENLPIRDGQNPGGELDMLRKREAIRAAIEEMREPTAAMLNAGWQKDGWLLAYRAAIDAALK